MVSTVGYLCRTVCYLLYNHRDCALWAENAQQAYNMLHTQKKRRQLLNLSQLAAAAADDDDRKHTVWLHSVQRICSLDVK